MMLWHCIEIYVPIPINNNLRNFLIQLINMGSFLQPLPQLLRYKWIPCSPLLETLSDQIMREPLVLLIPHFHLIIISIENNTLLYSLDVLGQYRILTNRELLDAKVILQSIGNQTPTLLVDAAVVQVEFDHAVVIQDKIGHCFGAVFT